MDDSIVDRKPDLFWAYGDRGGLRAREAEEVQMRQRSKKSESSRTRCKD